MSKYGPQDAWILVDGYNLTAARPRGLSRKVLNPTEDDSGIGVDWDVHLPMGRRSFELAQQAALFDEATGAIHDAIESSVPSSAGPAARVVNFGFAGQVIGRSMEGVEGAFNSEYEVLIPVGEMQKANAVYSASGAWDRGVVLQELADQTATWDTESSSVDNSASSAAGGVAFVQVTAFSGFTNLTLAVRHSADDAVYADLTTFSTITGIGAERVVVAGTVNRYLAISGTFSGGPGAATVFVGFARR